MVVIAPRLSLSKVNKNIPAHLLMVTVLSGEPPLQIPHSPQSLQLLQRPRLHHLILSTLVVVCHHISKDSLLSLANTLVTSTVTSLLNSLLLPLPVHQDHTLTVAQWGGVVGAVEDRGADDGVLKVLLTDITTPLGTSLIINTAPSAPR
jgi:hypothetical protein